MASAVCWRAVPAIIHDARISVVMTTYNRGDLLAGALESVLAQQEDSPPFELIVVDNNSTDNTREVIERFAKIDRRVRYVFEPQQGSSHGRNAGIHASTAPLVAFTDDDVRADADWVAAIGRAFDEHPEADVVGGRVLPIWPSPPPAWLTREHWMPLALIDYGDVPLAVDPNRPRCMVTANCSFRRAMLDRVGGFGPAFQLGKKGLLGSVEDQELQLRVLQSGGIVFYDPRVRVRAEIQPNRLERAYHRRWHTGHGYFYALLRNRDVEETRVGTLFGVPAHLYRQAVVDLTGWLGAVLTGNRERAFTRELSLCFFVGFFRTRCRDSAAQRFGDRLAALRRFSARVRRRPRTQSAPARAAGHQ